MEERRTGDRRKTADRRRRAFRWTGRSFLWLFLAAAVVLSFVVFGLNAATRFDCTGKPNNPHCKPTPTPTSTTSTPPASIDATGATDVATQLAVWMQSLPAGSTADLGTGMYRVEGSVKVLDQSGLAVKGGTLVRKDNATNPLLVYPNPNPLLWLVRCAGCSVTGTTFRGANTVADQRPGFGSYDVKYEFDAAIRVEQFTNFAVTGIDVDAVWGDGVQLQVGAGATLLNSRIDRIGRQGVTVIASGVLIDGVRVEHGRRSGFDLEPDSSGQVVENIEIRNSYANTIGLPFASAGRGQVNHVWLHHNTSAGSSVPVVYVIASDGSTRYDWRVEDHTAIDGLGSPSAGFRFAHVVGVQVARVNLPIVATQSRLGFECIDCGGTVSVTDSQFAGGIYYRNSAPRAGQVLTMTGNTPTLTEVP